MSVQETSSVQIEGVLQVDLFHVLVGRSSHTDDVERVTVQMERMAQVGLLNCVQKKEKTKM